jgi:hypothetical protein
MTTALKEQIRDLLTDSFVGTFLQHANDSREMALWQKAGRPAPPPHLVKQSILSAYASTFGTVTLIETGTFLGHMVYAMRNRFESIISVELGPDLARRAQRRFRDYPHIQILQGDSGEVLPRLLSNISRPSLFWLDGHYSAGITAQGNSDTPVMIEVEAILEHKITGHVILIDDARCFNGTQDYPTLDELRELFVRARPGYEFSVLNDVIRIHPKTSVESEF